MSRTSKSIIRAMYEYCNRSGVLSDNSREVMQEYFKRVNRLKTSGAKKTRKKL